MSKVTLLVNGKTLETNKTSLSELAEEFAPIDRPYAIEVNGIIIPRSEHIKTNIANDDRIEIISAVGGG